MSAKSDLYEQFIKPVQKAFGEVKIVGIEVDGHVIGDPIPPFDTTEIDNLRAFFGGPPTPAQKQHRGRK